MLTKPFNPAAESALPPERIEQLNHLALQAFKTDKSNRLETQPNMNDLMSESSAFHDLLTEVSNLGCTTMFYKIVDAAFANLLNSGLFVPSDVFSTYQMLTALFRVSEREKPIIFSKLRELEQINQDLDTLELEDMNRSNVSKKKKRKSGKKKGGSSC
jgi:hypothetical protein